MKRMVNLLIGALVMVPLMILTIALLPLLFFWQPGIVGELVSTLEELGERITGLGAK